MRVFNSGLQIPTNATMDITGKFTLAGVSGSTTQYLQGGGSGVTPTWGTPPNWYPTTFAWTAGTTSGPTGSLTGTGMSPVSFAAFPAANLSQSGIITTGAQNITGAKTFASSLTLRSGTTTASTAPLYFGTSTPAVVATPEAASVEYDGLVFYATPAVGTASTGPTVTGRGLVQTPMTYVINSDATIVNNVAYPATGTGNVMNGKGAWLLANTTYEIDFMWYTEVSAATAAATNFNLIQNLPSGASAWLSLQYTTPTSHTGQSTLIAWQAITDVAGTVTGGTATIQGTIGSGSIGYNRYWLRGIVKNGATAGYFYPQHSITPGTGGTAKIIVKLGSFAKVTPLGSSSADVNIGPWT